MPKEIKGNPRRKSPEPSTDHSDVKEWLGQVMPNVQEIVTAVDESIRATVPGLQYAVKYRRAFYGLPELGWIVEVAPYFVSVNVLFFAGATFDSPPPLGSTGLVRYIKLNNPDEAERPELSEWFTQAAQNPGWR